MTDINRKIDLHSLLGNGCTPRQALDAFAVINLGLVESMRDRVISPDDAIPRFYNAANCLFAHRKLKNVVADDIMGRGVQLSDLFDALPPATAEREFAAELNAMRKLCLKLLRGVHERGHSRPNRSRPRRKAS